MSSDLKLLGAWQSPYVIRVQMALKLKNIIEYAFVETDAYNKSEILLKSNPVHKKIPVLLHGDDKPICESLVIVQYIDEVWSDGPSILPPDPYDRSKARFWAAYIDEKLVPTLKGLKEAKTEEARAIIIGKMLESLKTLEDAFVGCGQGKGYFGGENVGYLDIVLGCYLGWMAVMETVMHVKCFDESSTPGLAAWARRMYSESQVKDVLPAVQRFLDILETSSSPTSSDHHETNY